MKIKYEFADGSVSEVEVDEEIGKVVIESRRKEENMERNARRNCYSMDALIYGDKDMYSLVDEVTPEAIIVHKEDRERVESALGCLSETQRRRVLMLMDGMSMHEIADVEGVNYSAVWKSIEGSKKFLKNFFQNG